MLAIAAHVVSGGMTPDIGVTALLTVGVAAVGVALADRRRGLGTILLTLGAAQIAMHVLLSMSGNMEMAGAMAPAAVDPLAMTTGHAVAAVLTAILLAGADSVLFRLIAALTRLVPSPWIAPRTSGVLTVAHHVDTVDRALAVLLRLASPRRGPPALA